MEGCSTGLLIDFSSPLCDHHKTPAKNVLCDLTNTNLYANRSVENVFEGKLIDAETSSFLETSKFISKCEISNQNKDIVNLIDDTVCYTGTKPKCILNRSFEFKENIHLEIPRFKVKKRKRGNTVGSHIHKAQKNKGRIIDSFTVTQDDSFLTIKENGRDLNFKRNLVSDFYLDDSNLLDDEQFDFDLSASSHDSTNDISVNDDEIFMGPIGFREKLILSTKKLSPDVKRLSPLTSEQWAELFREATTVTFLIDSAKEIPVKGNIKDNIDISDKIKRLSLSDVPFKFNYDSHKHVGVKMTNISANFDIDSENVIKENKSNDNSNNKSSLKQCLLKKPNKIETKHDIKSTSLIINNSPQLEKSSLFVKNTDMISNSENLLDIKPDSDGIVHFTADKKQDIIKPKAVNHKSFKGQSRLVGPKIKSTSEIILKDSSNPIKRQRLNSFGSDSSSGTCSSIYTTSESSNTSKINKHSSAHSGLSVPHPIVSQTVKTSSSILKSSKPSSVLSSQKSDSNSGQINLLVSKSKLIHPAEFQKLTVIQKKNKSIIPQTGPLRATAAFSAQTLTELTKSQPVQSRLSRSSDSSACANNSSTPIKQRTKSDIEKNTLNISALVPSTPARNSYEMSNFSSPSVNSSTLGTRRSFIPTPMRFSCSSSSIINSQESSSFVKDNGSPPLIANRKIFSFKK